MERVSSLDEASRYDIVDIDTGEIYEKGFARTLNLRTINVERKCYKKLLSDGKRVNIYHTRRFVRCLGTNPVQLGFNFD